MRTRTASVAEAVAVWVFVAATFVAAAAIYWILTEDYTRVRTEKEEKNAQIMAQVDQLKVKINALKAENKILDERLKKKEKEDKAQQDDLQKKIASLQKTIVYLPPIEYWPDLIKLIEVLAEEKKVAIDNYTMLERTELQSSNTQDTFTEYVFMLDMEGEYSRVMEYLWYLENAVYLTGRGGTTKWRAIIKVADSGFIIKQLNTDVETMKLRLQLMTFFRKGVGDAR